MGEYGNAPYFWRLPVIWLYAAFFFEIGRGDASEVVQAA